MRSLSRFLRRHRVAVGISTILLSGIYVVVAVLIGYDSLPVTVGYVAIIATANLLMHMFREVS